MKPSEMSQARRARASLLTTLAQMLCCLAPLVCTAMARTYAGGFGATPVDDLRGRTVLQCSPAEFVQSGIVDAEVMADLVDNNAANLLHQLVLGIAHGADGAAVDGDPVREDANVVRRATGEGNSAVQTEQARGTVAMIDGHSDVAHELPEGWR